MDPQKQAIEQIGLTQDTFSGKVVVVTGGGQGIGQAIARAFAWLGARVVIAELAESGKATEQITKEAGGEATFFQTDVSDPGSVANLSHFTHESVGPVDILINNAILCPVTPLLEMDLEVWERVMAVNLRGTFLTCKAFLPDMLAKGGGTIINMVSTDAMPGLSAYIASKQGIVGLSQSLAAEVGQQGIRVVAFAPGMVDTPGIRQVAENLAPQLNLSPTEFMNISLHPAYEGLMPAAHAAAATAYLAANLADEYHGQAVDGYTILEQAGLIAKPVAPEIAAISELPLAPVVTTERAELIDETIGLIQQLEDILVQTEDEFNRLPVFIRPMARSGLKGKSGQSIQEWKRTTARLVEQLQTLETDDTELNNLIRSGLALHIELLGKLVGYYQGVPAETSRFTKDAGLLRSIQLQMEMRVQLIQALISQLNGLVNWIQ